MTSRYTKTYPYVHLYWMFNRIYTLLLISIQSRLSPSWNIMVRYVCMPTRYCKLQYSGLLLIKQHQSQKIRSKYLENVYLVNYVKEKSELINFTNCLN